MSSDDNEWTDDDMDNELENKSLSFLSSSQKEDNIVDKCKMKSVKLKSPRSIKSPSTTALTSPSRKNMASPSKTTLTSPSRRNMASPSRKALSSPSRRNMSSTKIKNLKNSTKIVDKK